MWHIKKELGPCPKNWGRGANFKMTAKIREIGYLRKSRISEKSSGLNENCSNSANFWANVLKSFAFERYELYICNSSQNWALYLILRLKFGSEVKNSKIWDTQIFRRPNFAGPGIGPEKIFGPETFFIGSHMSQLEFWYPMTPPLSPDSGDFRR